MTTRRCFTEVSSGWRTHVLFFTILLVELVIVVVTLCGCFRSNVAFMAVPLLIDRRSLLHLGPARHLRLLWYNALCCHILYFPRYMNSKSLLQTDSHFSSSDPVVAAHCSPSIFFLKFPGIPSSVFLRVSFCVNSTCPQPFVFVLGGGGCRSDWLIKCGSVCVCVHKRVCDQSTAQVQIREGLFRSFYLDIRCLLFFLWCPLVFLPKRST